MKVLASRVSQSGMRPVRVRPYAHSLFNTA